MSESEHLRNALLLCIAEDKLEDIKSKCRRKLEYFLLETTNQANNLISMACRGQEIMELFKNHNFLSEEYCSLKEKQECLEKHNNLIKRIDNTFSKLKLITDMYNDIDIESVQGNIKRILEENEEMDTQSLEKLIISADILLHIKNDISSISQVNQKCVNQIQTIFMDTLLLWSKGLKDINNYPLD